MEPSSNPKANRQLIAPLPEFETFPTDLDSAYRRYSQSLQLVMMDFQLIEECLRMCLVRVYALIYFRLKDVLSFQIPVGELDKDALGRLISKYAQFCNDADLLKTLRELQPFRNQCAHRGMLLTLEQQRDVAFLAAETKSMYDKRVIANSCLNRLCSEWERLEEVLQDPARRSGLRPTTVG